MAKHATVPKTLLSRKKEKKFRKRSVSAGQERARVHPTSLNQLQIGSKIDMLSIMRIDLTAAYLLAAPTAPPAASEIALERARHSERITVSVARGILGTLGKKSVDRERAAAAFPDSRLLGQLLQTLESLRQRWHPRLHSVLARQLRDFADSLEQGQCRS